jgi:hypothetical protein
MVGMVGFCSCLKINLRIATNAEQTVEMSAIKNQLTSIQTIVDYLSTSKVEK